MNLIRYDYSSLIEPKERNDTYPDSCDIELSIETTINFELCSYFNWGLLSQNKADRKPYLFNFRELFLNAKKVIFYTYLKEFKTNLSEKIIIQKYRVTSCFQEMEIRFLFDKKIAINAHISTSDLKIQIAHTGMIPIIEKINGFVIKHNYSTERLNSLLQLKEIGINKFEKSDYELIELLEEYDDLLYKFYKNTKSSTKYFISLS